jgi:hypothetical protein
LGLLKPDAAQSLRRVPFGWNDALLSSDDEALIQELGGRHPYYIQMACYHLYKAWSQSTEERAQTVRERFDQDADPHLERLWDHLGSEYKAALKAAIGMAVPVNSFGQQMRRLARLGIVELTDDGWKPFSRAFAARITEYPLGEPTPTETEDPAFAEPQTLAVEPEIIEPQAPAVAPEIIAPQEKPETSPPGAPAKKSTWDLVVRLVVFAGVAIGVIWIAVEVSKRITVLRLPIVFVIVAVVLLFALVGTGLLPALTFVQFLTGLWQSIKKLLGRDQN